MSDVLNEGFFDIRAHLLPIALEHILGLINLIDAPHIVAVALIKVTLLRYGQVRVNRPQVIR